MGCHQAAVSDQWQSSRTYRCKTNDSLALPPINPTIAPKPIFQVVVQVSNRLTWSCDGDEQNDSRIDVSRDKAVSETTVKKTHLKTEFFFITHPQNKETYPDRKQRNKRGVGSFELESQQPVRLLNRLGGLNVESSVMAYETA